MKGFIFISHPNLSVPVVVRRLLPRVLQGFLILGFTFGTLFIGVSEADGLWDKPTPKPTHTDKPPKPSDTPPIIPTDTPFIVPTDTPLTVPTDTPVSSDTPDQTTTQTDTLDCLTALTPTSDPLTQTLIPTCTPTSTPSPTPTGTGSSSNPFPPSDSTASPVQTKTLPLTNTPGGTEALILFGPPPTALETPTETVIFLQNPRIDLFSDEQGIFATPSDPMSRTIRTLSLFLFTALVIGGGVIAAVILRDHKESYEPSMGGGEASATLALNPVAVGAFGFSAWLAGQTPMLTYGEKVVLSKVGNGIGSAIHLVGGVSDLKKISEMGTQEFHQLTAGSPFRTGAIRGMGLAG